MILHLFDLHLPAPSRADEGEAGEDVAPVQVVDVTGTDFVTFFYPYSVIYILYFLDILLSPLKTKT